MSYRDGINWFFVLFNFLFIGSIFVGDREFITFIGMFGVPVWMVQLMVWQGR